MRRGRAGIARRAMWLAGAAALASGLVLATASRGQAVPEDLLPDAFGAPAPAPVAPTPRPAAPARPAAPGGSAAAPRPASNITQPGITQPGITQPNITQPGVAPPGAALPGIAQPGAAGVPALLPGALPLPEGLPPLSVLEAMEPSEIDELLGLRPKHDIPPGARRALRRIGVMSMAEGGFPARALAGQPPALIAAALAAAEGPLVSRWGHILLRRVLASRLDTPQGLDPVNFAALRARALNAMGEGAVARHLVQDVDSSNYNRALADAAFAAHLMTGDILGMCPIARLQPNLREDGEWEMLQAICLAYAGEARSAERRLQRALGTGRAPEIDVRLAQRFAGAAADGRRAVNIEWTGVNELNAWRIALALALGLEIPRPLVEGAGSRFGDAVVQIPASPLLQRAAFAQGAAGRGVFSAAALVDLESQLWASEQYSTADKARAAQLRQAYAGATPADRLAALRALWADDRGGQIDRHGRLALTAYAAARMPVNEQGLADAPMLIAAMLSAGLDRNALRWGNLVPEGSEGWALLVLAQPSRRNPADAGAIERFIDEDASDERRKSKFLVAGIAALGRVSAEDAARLAGELDLDLARRSAWSDKITRAAAVGNPALVALLAGVGMRGQGWDQMTARHLFVIVRALNQVGLGAEARMIAAEAVARA